MTPYGDCALTCALLDGTSRHTPVIAVSAPSGALSSWAALQDAARQPKAYSEAAVELCAPFFQIVSAAAEVHCERVKNSEATRRLDMRLIAYATSNIIQRKYLLLPSARVSHFRYRARRKLIAARAYSLLPENLIFAVAITDALPSLTRA
jgi:hypothetical protein